MSFSQGNISSYILLGPVELVKKLTGLAEIWARVVLGFGLIYCNLLCKPRLLSRGGYPIQLSFYALANNQKFLKSFGLNHTSTMSYYDTMVISTMYYKHMIGL